MVTSEACPYSWAERPLRRERGATLNQVCVCVCVCVCVREREGERESVRERERGRERVCV